MENCKELQESNNKSPRSPEEPKAKRPKIEKETSNNESKSESIQELDKTIQPNQKQCNLKKSPYSSDNESSDSDALHPRIKKERPDPVEVKVAKIIENSKINKDIEPTDQEENILDSEALSKLVSIRIELPADILPQHTVETYAGTRVPSKREKTEIRKYVKIKYGPYKQEEDKIIVHNWKQFCKEYNWKEKLVYPFMHLKCRGFFYISALDERRKFVQYLARGLPNRTLYSVYHRFKNLYSTHKQDRYSEYEDMQLLASIRKNLEQGEKPNYAVLAKKFCRTRASLWRRYKLLMEKQSSN